MKDKVLIYIIRHGETRANVSGFIQGWMNEPLNEAGVSLAEDTGRGMRGVHFDACFSSPLLRASQTARIVLRESGNESAPLTFDDRIKEIGFGTCEGRRITEGGLPPEEARLFFTDPFRFPGFPGADRLHPDAGVPARAGGPRRWKDLPCGHARLRAAGDAERAL